MSVRTDIRLLDVPMQDLSCQACAASVQVRKATWQQTSIQWDETGTASCQERAKYLEEGGKTSEFRGCEQLAETIRQATADGRIEVVYQEEEQNGQV